MSKARKSLLPAAVALQARCPSRARNLLSALLSARLASVVVFCHPPHFETYFCDIPVSPHFQTAVLRLVSGARRQFPPLLQRLPSCLPLLRLALPSGWRQQLIFSLQARLPVSPFLVVPERPERVQCLYRAFVSAVWEKQRPTCRDFPSGIERASPHWSARSLRSSYLLRRRRLAFFPVIFSTVCAP